jgi:hypothetical protein
MKLPHLCPIPLFRRLALACLVGAVIAGAGPKAQADPNWSGMSYTLFRDMQAVNASGGTTWAVPAPGPTYEQGYKLRGVVLNNPGDMLDSTANYSEGPTMYMGGQWQVYIQWIDNPDISYDDNDFGGAALWMGQNYGNHYWHLGNYTYNYSNAAWNAEVARVGLNGTLQAGDLIEVHARGGLFYNGKFNVNEQHDNDPLFDFDVVLLGHAGLPEATPITLDLIKNQDDTFKFDTNRTLLTNPEHYQATLVEILDVSLVDAAGWGNNASLTVTDGGGLTMTLKLGLNGFDSVAAPEGLFDVVGIFDQEGVYRLWVMDASQFAVPEPAGAALAGLGAAALLALGGWRRRGRGR